jgi:hypothetical protein
MTDYSFGFDVKKSEQQDLNEARDSIMTDIENYWGHECLATSSFFTLTIS